MNISVLPRTPSSDVNHSGTAGEIDGKFSLKCRTNFRAIEIVDQLPKLRPEGQFGNRKAARPKYLRVIVVDRFFVLLDSQTPAQPDIQRAHG